MPHNKSVEELLAAHRLFQETTTLLPGAVFRIRLSDSAVTYASSGYQRLTGYSSDEVVGVAGFGSSRLHPDDLQRLAAEFGAPENLDSRNEMDFRWLHKDGEYRWFYTSYTIQQDDDGELYMTGYATDVTERKEVDERHAREIRAAKEQAERANVAKSEFLSRMSHELRTPLAAILGFASLIDRDSLQEDDNEGVQYISDAGNHLLQLINEVLDIAKVESGHLTISKEPVAVEDVVTESIGLVQIQAEAAGVTVSVAKTSDPTLFVLADRQRVKQILINLLSNGVKYNRRGGSVTVCYETRADEVVLNVTDTGLGIRTECLDDLFTPFERLGADQTEIEGTGLGLALTKKLVEALDGSIEVVSSEGRGSTFTITLPLIVPPAPAVDVSSRDAQDRIDRVLPLSRILYVEDNPSNIRLVQRYFGRHPEVRLEVKTTGAEALSRIRDVRPDVLLLDVNLPDMPGGEVLEAIRSDPSLATLPVIGLSADATQDQVQRLLDIGADDYVTKPVDFDRLEDVLRRLISEQNVKEAV